jgi:hypothetical protein
MAMRLSRDWTGRGSGTSLSSSPGGSWPTGVTQQLHVCELPLTIAVDVLARADAASDRRVADHAGAGAKGAPA